MITINNYTTTSKTTKRSDTARSNTKNPLKRSTINTAPTIMTSKTTEEIKWPYIFPNDNNDRNNVDDDDYTAESENTKDERRLQYRIVTSTASRTTFT